jgi:hypothetical protein
MIALTDPNSSPRATARERTFRAVESLTTDNDASIRTIFMTDNSRPAVLLHSGFRTGSTWFWNCFRRAANTCAFYEPFHECLAELHPDTFETTVANGKRATLSR